MGKYLIKNGTLFGNALKKAKQISIKENTPVRIVFNNTTLIIHKKSNLRKAFDQYLIDSGCRLKLKSNQMEDLKSYIYW